MNWIDMVLTAVIDTLAWLRQCDEHEPTTRAELYLHAARCLIRMIVFIVGTSVLVWAAIRLTEVIL